MLQDEIAPQTVVRAVPHIGPQFVTKTELATRLGWSRPRLDRRLGTDPRFPVAYRGGQGQGRAWKFDLDAVKAYLHDSPETPDESTPAPSQSPSVTHVQPNPDTSDTDLDPVVDVREGTARARRDMAQAQIYEDKLRRDRAELVEASDVKQSVSTMLVHLGKGMEALPEQIVTRLHLPAEHTLTIRNLVNALRTNMVGDLQKVLSGHG